MPIEKSFSIRNTEIGIQVDQSSFSFDCFEENLLHLAGAESLGGTVSSVVAQKVRKQIETLEEENNMLKIKVEVLLNLVAESAAELTQARR